LWPGCRRDEKGGIISDPITEESSVPGVYAAGDASRDVLLVAVAIAEGAKAAVAINRGSAVIVRAIRQETKRPEAAPQVFRETKRFEVD
jgi:pyruvate/2-oxoglutarate dehydrogenase complex dihydrolipoamide dehydrogenase (E3) component